MVRQQGTDSAGASRPAAASRSAIDTPIAEAVALHQAGRIDEAIQAYNAILEQGPTVGVLNNLGVALRQSKRYEAAVVCYLRALELDSENQGTWSNLGNVYRDMGRIAEAADCHRRAAALNPGNPTSLYNLGLTLRDNRELDEALRYIDRAISLDPHNPEFNWDKAFTLLYSGDYARGLKLYDWRLRLTRARRRTFHVPRWNGEALAGRTLFLHAEQGFGDMIQFVRFVHAVSGPGEGKVIVECPPQLLRVLSTVPGDFELVDQEETPPPFDLYAPLLSVPGILGLSADDFGNEVPYLKAPVLSGTQLPPNRDNRLRVGIVWAGATMPRDRSAPLDRFLKLAAIPGIEWFSLQTGARAGDLGRLTGGAVIKDMSDELDDFADTAAILAQLDLLIAVDTACAHLAGGMGIPVWTLLTYVGDWRWRFEGGGSLWYPTMRLFRQGVPGDWDLPFAQVDHALRVLTAERRPAKPN